MIANETTDKGLISKIYKQLIQLCQKNKQPNQRVGKRHKQTFLQRHTDGSQTHERCSTSLIVREMQIKTTWCITSHLSEWPSSKSLQKLNAEEGMEKREHLHSWWECKLLQTPWKTVWRFLRELGIKPPYENKQTNHHMTQQSHS